MTGIYRKYTFELLLEAVEHSTSVAGVLRYLGLNQAGGTHAHISRTIKSFKIDTSHFVRYQNGSAHKRFTAAQILIQVPRGSRRTRPRLLRRALDEVGVQRECDGCGIDESWQGRPLVLEIDHIDGDYHNNTIGNLRCLCPNCHAQTENYCGRSAGKYTRVRPDAPTLAPGSEPPSP